MKSNSQKTINELVAGSFGGAAQVLVGQPLDTVKTRAQIAPVGMFNGPMDILKQTLRKEGFFALYKGMASPLIGIAGVNSLLFAAYGTSKRIISPYPNLSLKEIAAAGAMAGAANVILASPVEMFKVRMQGQYGAATDKRLRAVLMDMWTEWGFRKGIMRGYWVTVAREIPAYAGFYSAFEFSKRKFGKKYGKDIPVWALLASGSTGGIAYWLSCYPLDVVKSRVQLRSTPPTGTPVQYIAHELKAIVQESGFVGLFRGLSPSLLRSIPAAASTFAAFEITRDYLETYTDTLKPRSIQTMSISYLSLNESQPCTIVLIHGVTESRLEWDFVTPYLRDYHLLVVDCPGHSGSAHILPAVIPNSTDHIASLIRSHAHGGKAHIVGLSMGGFITLDLARRYPELVLSAFATGAAPYEGFYKWMSVHPRFVYFMMGVLDKTPERLYWWIAERRGMKKNEKLRKEMKVNSRRWEVVKDVYTSILDFGFEQAREIKVRTLAVAGGREDQVGPTRRMGEIWKEEGVKGSKAVVVRNAYHAWDLQMPELFAQGVLAWIEGRDLPPEFEELA